MVVGRTFVLLGVLLAVLAGTGVLPRSAALVGVKALGRGDLVGLTPAFLSRRERARAGYEDVAAGQLEGKVCLVTGGNAGLGLQSAIQLARKGCHVVVAGRRLEACEAACGEVAQAAPNGACTAMLVDLSDLASVSAFSKRFLAEFSRLDVFMQNAGIAYAEPAVTVDGIDIFFAVNHLSHFAMTLHLQALLEKTAAEHGSARVVVVGSAAHFFTTPPGVYTSLDALNAPENFSPLRYYGQSKLANVLFAQELSRRLRGAGHNIFVNVAHPGMVSTSITAPGKARLRAFAAPYPLVAQAAELVIAVVDWVESSLIWSAVDGARTQVYLAASPEVETGNLSGLYFHPQAIKVEPSNWAQGEVGLALARDLWAFSEALLQR